MAIIYCGFIGAAAAYSLWIWMGAPDSSTGEYNDNMILSALGEWLLFKWHSTKNKIYKLFLCPYCLSVWLAALVALSFDLSVYKSILSAACAAPFVSLFYYFDR
jgi:hypothetical protein